jgi:hypothetical protein
MASKEFEALSIPEWKLNLADASAKFYRVFKNAQEFEMVEAENAAEAIAKCGTQPIYMIKFGNMDNHGIIGKEALAKMELSAPAAV